MSKPVMEITEANKMNDDELLSLLGWLYDNIKTLEENKKTDETILAYRAKIEEHAETIYTLPIKDYRKKLAGVRYVAQMRGLEFKVPERDET